MMQHTRLKHFTKAQQLNPDILQELFERADVFRQNPDAPVLKRKIMVQLFYEPSTRTRLSFGSAMLRLGGKVLETENAKDFSSAVKGESLEDTIRVVQHYGDVIVVRHPEEGSADRMAALSSKPVINAGDGKGQHPTQALLDLYTIKHEIGRLDNITVAFVGDLANGRTARSLAYLLAHCGRAKMIFVSPPHLRIGEDIKNTSLAHHQVEYLEVDDLDGSREGIAESERVNVLRQADVVYMTRLQKERMTPEHFEAARGKLVIGPGQLELMKPKARLMHPLPKVDEINLPIDTEQNDPRVAYFRQSENGIAVRMALLENMLRV